MNMLGWRYRRNEEDLGGLPLGESFLGSFPAKTALDACDCMVTWIKNVVSIDPVDTTTKRSARREIAEKDDPSDVPVKELILGLDLNPSLEAYKWVHGRDDQRNEE